MRIDDDERVARLLAEPDASSALAMVLAGLGASVLIVAGGIAMVQWQGMDATFALVAGEVLLVASVLVCLLTDRREERFRMLIRDALLPGDLLMAHQVRARRADARRR